MLARRVRLGDVEAFEQIFRLYAEPLCAFTLRYVRSRDIARELVQTLFVRLWEQRDRWEPRVTLRSFLFSAARNQALDHLRHARTVERWEDREIADVAHAPKDDVTPDTLLEHKELAAIVSHAIDALPPRTRLALTLRWFDDLSYGEIAEIMGISIKTVENQLVKGLKTLRQALAGHVR